MNDIDVIVTQGPTIYNDAKLTQAKYLTIGVKYSPDVQESTMIAVEKLNSNMMDEMLLHIKREISKLREPIETAESDSEVISLTDKFFEYLKNNETKVQAIRVSLGDYDQDYKDQKLRTIKTQMMVITADEQSMDDMFDMVVKRLYYEFEDTVVDLYSIILTPKLYKIINNIPVEYRGVLIRVKK